VFSVAVATVIFPTLSRLVARHDQAGLRATLAHGTRQMLFLLIPTTAALLVLSDPITQVIYQRGQFDAAQTDLVSEALFYFALSLPTAGVNLILIRTFFSLQRPWTPTAIALANLGLNAVLDALLYKPMGIGGIPLSTAIVSLVTTVSLALVLRTRIGGLYARATLDTALRITIAAGLLALAALGVKTLLDSALPSTSGAQLLVIAAAGTAGLVTYAAAAGALRIAEAREVAALVRGQLARLRSAA
jgi:putative peptidoglycan lipid II flippase